MKVFNLWQSSFCKISLKQTSRSRPHFKFRCTTERFAISGFFVTSCGFGLIEQAAHWAANQVDHGDEVGLVPVAACA
jgi:hypothetical protein